MNLQEEAGRVVENNLAEDRGIMTTTTTLGRNARKDSSFSPPPDPSSCEQEDAELAFLDAATSTRTSAHLEFGKRTSWNFFVPSSEHARDIKNFSFRKIFVSEFFNVGVRKHRQGTP